MRVTIKDLAERAGCSITTVSHILNGKGARFSPDLRDNVLRLADQLGYQPDPIAVSMVTGRTRTIGLILPNIHNMFFALLAEEIEKYCHQLDYNVILCNSMDNRATEHTYIQALLARKVDGILLALASDSTMSGTMDHARLAEEKGIPVCLIDRMVSTENLDMVSIDHELGGFLACQHLIDLGHREIAFLTGPSKQLNSQLRLKGAKSALRQYGRDMLETAIFPGDYSWECGYRQADAILASGATGLFAFNDWSAFGVIMKLNELHKSVPQDLSIIAYDNIPFLNGGVLSLSTIHQPIDQLAQAGIDTLLNRLDNPGCPYQQHVLEPKLIERDSTMSLVQGR